MGGRLFVLLGALALASGVALGAVGSHAAASSPHPEAGRLIQTAVLYQLVHGLGLVATGTLALACGPSRWLAIAGAAMAAGIVTFCGALYSLAFRAVSLGVVAPIGGTLFIVAWLALAAWAFRRPSGAQ